MKERPQKAHKDDELMEKARSGDQSAFDVLVRRHQARAMQIALRHTGSPQLAEDVVQDTFVELHRCLGRYRAEGKFSIFFYRIVLSRARMAHRSLKRARLLLVQPPERVEAPIAEAKLLEIEQCQEVHRAISALPEHYRSVVTLRFGADLSYAEIAEVLKIPIGTVRSRIFTAMAKLRRRLKEKSHVR